MSQIKYLKNLSPTKFQSFLNSFDDVLLDCDGVLFHLFEPIPGTKESVEALQNSNKNTYFVTNNGALTSSVFHELFIKCGYKNVTKEHIVTPTLVIVDYLKSINFNKNIYLIGMNAMQRELEEAGFKVLPKGPSEVNSDDAKLVLRQEMKPDSSIGAVIVDNDLDVNFIRLTKAAANLLRKDVTYLASASDFRVPLGGGNFLIGTGYFQQILNDMTNRKPEIFGKPSKNLEKYIQNVWNVKNPERTLFIGDSLRQDMAFASQCGFKKLLVLTGNTHLEDLPNINDENEKPDYYLNSLGELIDIINEKKLSKH